MSPGVALTPHALPNTPPPAATAIFVELTQAMLQRLRDQLGQDVDGTTFPDMLKLFSNGPTNSFAVRLEPWRQHLLRFVLSRPKRFV